MFASFVSIPVFLGRTTNVGKVMYTKPFMFFHARNRNHENGKFGNGDPRINFSNHPDHPPRSLGIEMD